MRYYTAVPLQLEARDSIRIKGVQDDPREAVRRQFKRSAAEIGQTDRPRLPSLTRETAN